MDTIREIGIKTLYLADGREASEWVREPIKGVETLDAPQMSSGLKIKTSGTMRGKLAEGSLLYATSKSNNIMSAGEYTFFTSSCPAQGNGGNSVTEGEGWRRAIALYAARKLSKDTWITHNDEYLVPNTYREVG